jgi:hypothetical protein
MTSAALLGSCALFNDEPTLPTPTVRCPEPPAILMEPVRRPQPIREAPTPDDERRR